MFSAEKSLYSFSSSVYFCQLAILIKDLTDHILGIPVTEDPKHLK